eukprot:gene16432-7841_t
MTAGPGKLFRPSAPFGCLSGNSASVSDSTNADVPPRMFSNVTPSKEVLFKLREITGKSPEQIKYAYMACSGDMKKAVALLTGNQTADANEGTSQLDEAQEEVIEISDDKDDDLAKAIELSLREAHGGFGLAVSEEDKEISKALEASLVDNRSGNKRKRGNIWMSFIDPENPHERKRKEGVPVGLKNIGNTCWFSAVIQSLFHIPKFRNLVLNCGLSQDLDTIKDQPKLAFLAELQKLFILLLCSKRKYVDPARPIEILEDAVRKTGKENAGDQQDVSEFTHVLLDWLEDAFQSHFESSGGRNPIAELFYGRYSVNGCYDGKEVKSEETFGALPIHVRGHAHIYDGLDAAMDNNEIKTNDDNSAGSSSQEHWFTHLPPVLTFELSRFIFNQQLARAEKIHDPFRIEQTIHLARYMSFGSGPKKSPIISTLDSTLEFVRMGLNKEEEETPMTISPSSSPSSSTMQESIESSSILATAESIEGPSPKNMTAVEGNTLIDCLQRLKEEVQQETEALKDAIEYIDRELHHAYDEDILQQVPYRLHAILVHEGQANGGHYWSYIFDAQKKIWRKFNDVTVSETTWDEVQRESVGGYRNATAYCLVYVDAQRSDLFQVDPVEAGASLGFSNMQRFAASDNENFCREIEEWDAKQRKVEIAKEKVQNNDKENIPMAVDSAKVSPKMSSSSDVSLEEQLDAFYSDHRQRMSNYIAQRKTYDPDGRLENFDLYFFNSEAPRSVLDQGFLEWFTEHFSNKEPKSLLLQKHAKRKLKKILESAGDNEEHKKWTKYYKMFLKCNACFVTGVEEYYNKRFRGALPCFIHAIEINKRLMNAEGTPGHVDSALLSYFRRSCLQHVNEEASTSFQSDSEQDVEEGCALMRELVIPSLASFTETDDPDDLLIGESLRGRWCAFVGSPEIQGQKNEMLEEIIMGLVDSCTKMTVREPTIKGPINGTHLSKRYSDVMELLKSDELLPLQ